MSERASTPGRIELLQPGQHRLDLGRRAAEPQRDLVEVAGQIAGLVDQIDQMQADQALGAGRQIDLQLLDQMLAQGLGPAEAGLEVEPLVVEIGAAAAADRRQRR